MLNPPVDLEAKRQMQLARFGAVPLESLREVFERRMRELATIGRSQREINKKETDDE